LRGINVRARFIYSDGKLHFLSACFMKVDLKTVFMAALKLARLSWTRQVNWVIVNWKGEVAILCGS